MKRQLGTILIIAGLVVVLVPLVGRFIAERKQEALLEAYYLEAAEEVAEETDAAYQQLEEIFETGTEEAALPLSSGGAVAPVEEGAEEGEGAGEAGNLEESLGTLKTRTTALGIIRIPKINVSMPIAEGTTSEILNYYVGHMEGTAPLGTIGNAALAAHRGYSYGTYFYRLDELEKGDEIHVEADGRTHTYTVYEKKFVAPDDLSVLKGSSRYKVLTLITCDPPIRSTRRLIVHAIVAE